jgi:hypothetical protein
MLRDSEASQQVLEVVEVQVAVVVVEGQAV